MFRRVFMFCLLNIYIIAISVGGIYLSLVLIGTWNPAAWVVAIFYASFGVAFGRSTYREYIRGKS